MKICPECGEVYPDIAGVCGAHRIALLDWGQSVDSPSATGLVTDVDTRRVEDEVRFEYGSVAGEIETAPMARELEGPLGSHGTPRVELLDGTRTRQLAPQGGRVLCGRYRLGTQLGIGGFGAVFEGLDQLTGDQVAVKVLSPAAAQSSELITRFHREAIAASRVQHPNIVDVRDFDVDADGTHFIVMEYLDGIDLSEVIDEEEALEPSHALSIAAQCADGLAAAHEAGILHRDLKPANVFLVDRGEGVKIIDFGISKLTQAAGQYSDLTSASRVVGTPCYMSPEQAMGKELDGRCDVYGLGIILFEMLTGERPFVGRSAIEILDNHIHAPRVSPSSLRPSLGAWPGLDDLVLRSLAARPKDRFPSMEAFAEAIRASLSRTTVRDARPFPSQRRARLLRPILAVAGLLVAAGVALALLRGDGSVATASSPDSAPPTAVVSPREVTSPPATTAADKAPAAAVALADAGPPAVEVERDDADEPEPESQSEASDRADRNEPSPRRRNKRSRRPKERRQPMGIPEW